MYVTVGAGATMLATMDRTPGRGIMGPDRLGRIIGEAEGFTSRIDGGGFMPLGALRTEGKTDILTKE